jgi:hypothetical protein
MVPVIAKRKLALHLFVLAAAYTFPKVAQRLAGNLGREQHEFPTPAELPA